MKLRIVVGAAVLVGALIYGFALGRAEIFPYETLQRINWSVRDRTQKTGAEVTQFDEFQPDVDVVFLGSSTTARGNWHDMFPDISLANRGVLSESAEELTLRLDEVTVLTPTKVFVMAGSADIAKRRPVTEIVSSFEQITNVLTEAGATVYVQSELECALPPCGRFLDEVRKLNGELAELASRDSEVVFVDVGEALSGANGLRREYAIAGGNLTAEGYVAWRDHLLPYVTE